MNDRSIRTFTWGKMKVGVKVWVGAVTGRDLKRESRGEEEEIEKLI